MTEGAGGAVAGSVFEAEVQWVAALEGVEAPRVVVDDAVTGRAATSLSGRLVRVHPEVLCYPEPAQRWLAAHEMRHALAHGWRDPGRWVGFAVTIAGLPLLVVAVLSPLPSLAMVVWATVGAVGLVVLGLMFTLWWSRRVEADADRYAARAGRLAGLDEPSLTELLIGHVDAPWWLATHPRWLDRIPVTADRLPHQFRILQDQLDQVVDGLCVGGWVRWRRPPTLVLVHQLPGRRGTCKERLVVGRWGRVVVAEGAFATPVGVLQPQLAAAVVRARRLPQVRAAAAGGAASFGLVVATVAVVVPASGWAVLMCGFGVVLVMIGGYEMYRRASDRRLLRAWHP